MKHMITPAQLCMGCLTDKGAAQVCPACGWRETAQPESTLYLPPRTVLHGQYLIGRVLGHGGFGITYLAWDLNLGIKLAIKEFLPQQLAVRSSDQMTVRVHRGQSQEAFAHGLDKFLDEARTLARFQGHSSIVSVLNFFREHGTGYMVMPFVEGLTLQEYLNQHGGRLPYETAVNILMPVMDALRAVHQVGLLHRDVSPDNIYLTRDKQVMLLDFGAARYAVGEQSNSLSVILKPGYAPEEQYRRHGQQGPWTDVYAVAATMYRTITGRVPVDSLDRLADDNLEPPSRLGAHLPQAAEQSLLKAMAVRPPDRYQTVAEFQTALISGKAAGLQPTFTTAPAQQHTPPAGKSKTGLWTTVLAVLAMLIMGFAVYYFHSSEAELARQQAERRALEEARAQAEQRVLEQERVRQQAEQELAQQQAERRALEAELARQQAERRALEEARAREQAEQRSREQEIARQQAERRALEEHQAGRHHRVESFIADFLAALNGGNVASIMAFYADNVDYFSAGIVSKEFIYSDKQNYYKRWSQVNNQLISVEIQDRPRDDEKKVEFMINFRVYSGERREGIEGKANNVIVVRDTSNGLKIINEKQKVINRQKF